MAKRRKKLVIENRSSQGRGRKITVDFPLTVKEMKFLDSYMIDGDVIKAMRYAGYTGADSTLKASGSKMLNKPNVAVEYRDRVQKMTKKSVASSEEVMSYLTSVMRGEVKDQFGLDAPLAERTKAAQELAKRTIDVENRAQGKADNVVEIKIDWSRE